MRFIIVKFLLVISMLFTQEKLEVSNHFDDTEDGYIIR